MSEQSMMSTAEGSSMDVSQGSTAGASAGGGGNRSMILIGLVVFLLLGGLAYFFVFSSPSTGDPTEEGSGGNGGNGGNGAGLGSDSSPGSPPSPAFPSPARPTTAAQTGAETPTASMDTFSTDTQTDHSKAETTGAAATPATLVQAPTSPTPPPNNVKLLCTFGVSGVDISMVPPDDVCDYIFYTNVHYNIKQKKIMPVYGKTAFDVLKEAANTYKSTTMGTSMETGSISGIVANQRSQLKSAMEEIFKEKFVHFGMLYLEKVDLNFDTTYKTGDLEYLSVADEVLKPKASVPTYHIAVGMSVTTDAAQVLADKALEAVSLFPGITIVILKTHKERAHVLNDTFPAPANIDYDDFADLKFLNLNNTAPILPKLDTITAEGGRYLMISLAMFALAFRMNANFTGIKLDLANKSTLIDYPATCDCSQDIMCSHKRHPRDKKHSSSTMVFWSNRTVVLYEDKPQMETKARRRMDLLVPKRTFGLAVYHVEMDDPAGVCGASYERLHAIKSVVAEFNRP